MENISFPVDGLQLSGTLFRARDIGPAPALLCLHGWTSRQDRYFNLAQLMNDHGYTCLTMDMRGHGKSEGILEDLSREDFLNDVIAGYDFLAKVPGVDTSRITILGSSFGGYMTALLSAERPCAAIQLRAPANYPDEGFTESHHKRSNNFFLDTERKAWKMTLHPPTATKALRAVHAFRGPVMIVESEQDEIVPQIILQGYADAVSDKSQLTYVVMQGAPHSLSSDPERQKEYANLTLAWAQSTR